MLAIWCLRTVTIAASRSCAFSTLRKLSWIVHVLLVGTWPSRSCLIESAMSNMTGSLCLCCDLTFVPAPGAALRPVAKKNEAEGGTPPVSFGAPPDDRMLIAALEGELSLSGDDDYAFPGRRECRARVESSTASQFFEARRVVSQWRFSAPPPVPFFQEVHEELTRSWKAPFTARNKSWSSTPLTTLDGGDALGYTGIPLVERSVAM